MVNIRKYAKSIGFDVVGNLKRLGDSEGYRLYVDDGGNEYLVNMRSKSIVICTADGGVI